MEQPILISNLNDFIFCPASVYFHGLYNTYSTMLMQNTDQRNGSYVHEKLDYGGYSSRKDTLTGISVYCEKYGLTGKIDCYLGREKELIERKKCIRKVYDGYIFQLYGQYFAMTEMGYEVKKLSLYSYDQNRKIPVVLPLDDLMMLRKFEKTIREIHSFTLESFHPQNREKCLRCIYEPICDRSLI